ncbi:MAG TPA: ferrochelatase [Candidatus Limnocylindrales bacterium]|nr:ferrochelatase [Candidatus Limnocylindrales bacterium]
MALRATAGDGAFDALLVLSFGGPEGPEEVMPFLENVTRGRGVPRERLEQVARQYMLFGGVSPINDECRKLISVLEAELQAAGLRLPVYWGNRNWTPLLADTVAQMAHDGVTRALAIATSAYSSYSACRQYLDDIDRARAAVGAAAPVIEKIPPYWNHPGFIETMAASVRAALEALGDVPRERTRLVFTAHSIPASMAATCDYVEELREASRLVAERAAPALGWDLVYQSRSGAPGQAWLEPDVRDHLVTLPPQGVAGVVLVPIGFVADHMEVKFDLDVEAAQVAVRCGLAVSRAACVGAAPRFVAGLVDIVRARLEGRAPRVLGARGARPWPCKPGCCAYTPGRP